jgi:hypothetical protein
MFGIFDPITKAVENTLDIADCLVSGEAPSKKQIAKLISDGVSIYAISSATGIAVDVLQSIIDE